MPSEYCAIVVERLDSERFRATCSLFPDCVAVAPTEEGARDALESAIDAIIRRRHEAAYPLDDGHAPGL